MDNTTEAMKTFFDTDLRYLELTGRWFEGINTMTWTWTQLPDMYWRKCYSYLLCSIVGALEDAYNSFEESRVAKERAVKESFAH